jgi:hypothetical protein
MNVQGAVLNGVRENVLRFGRLAARTLIGDSGESKPFRFAVA